MNDRNGYISLEGLDKVTAALERTDKVVRDAAMKGLRKAGMEIIADAQVNLRNNTSVVTGLLRQSGKVQKGPSDTSLDVGFFDTTNQHSGYALYVEYGRRAGKFPPVDELVQWARKKFRLDEKAARSVGFLTARKIARQGSEPHPFFMPAVKKNYQKILNAVSDAVRRRLK